jgi:hypothetical protein
MKIVFLDFDGVLNTLLPHENHGPFSKAACSHVNTLLHKVPDLRIVISSAWRHHGIDYCRKALQEHGIDPIRVIDTTPLNEEIGRFDRNKEIKTWLEAHPEIVHFVILDDYFSMPSFRNKFVKTNQYVGFTEADLQKALEILDGQSR